MATEVESIEYRLLPELCYPVRQSTSPRLHFNSSGYNLLVGSVSGSVGFILIKISNPPLAPLLPNFSSLPPRSLHRLNPGETLTNIGSTAMLALKLKFSMINLWECRRFRFLQGFFDRQRFLSTFPFVSCYRGTSELSLAANYA